MFCLFFSQAPGAGGDAYAVTEQKDVEGAQATGELQIVHKFDLFLFFPVCPLHLNIYRILPSKGPPIQASVRVPDIPCFLEQTHRVPATCSIYSIDTPYPLSSKLPLKAILSMP